MEIYTPLARTTSLRLLKLDHLFLQTEHGEFEHVKLCLSRVFCKNSDPPSLMFCWSSSCDPWYLLTGQASLVGLYVQHKQGTWVIKGLVLEILTYVGMNVVPLMGMYFTRIFCNNAPRCLQPVTYTYYSFTSTCAKHEPFCKLPILRRWQKRKLLCMFRIPGNTLQC